MSEYKYLVIFREYTFDRSGESDWNFSYNIYDDLDGVREFVTEICTRLARTVREGKLDKVSSIDDIPEFNLACNYCCIIDTVCRIVSDDADEIGDDNPTKVYTTMQENLFQEMMLSSEERKPLVDQTEYAFYLSLKKKYEGS